MRWFSILVASGASAVDSRGACREGVPGVPSRAAGEVHANPVPRHGIHHGQGVLHDGRLEVHDGRRAALRGDHQGVHGDRLGVHDDRQGVHRRAACEAGAASSLGAVACLLAHRGEAFAFLNNGKKIGPCILLIKYEHQIDRSRS